MGVGTITIMYLITPMHFMHVAMYYNALNALPNMMIWGA